MKRKHIIYLMAICMTVSGGGVGVVAFADTAVIENAVSVDVAKPIELSLEAAYKKLADSKTMELITLKKQSDQNAAKGYSESVSNLNKQEKEDSFTYDSTSKAMVQAKRSFANKMVEANHEARINGVKQELTQKYYKVKNIETQVEIERASAELKESLLEGAERKHQVGTISAREFENAEKVAQDAAANVTAIENTLKQEKESLNSYLGYDILQELILTDELEEAELSKTTLEEAIASALANRNEIKETEYNVEIAQLNLNNYKAYPSSSSKYISAKTQLLNAEIAKDKKPTDIELDVKTKYNQMNDGKNSVQMAKTALKTAEDALKSVESKHKLGMVTESEVKQATLSVNNAKLSLAGALLTYNLAVESYDLLAGVGTKAATV